MDVNIFPGIIFGWLFSYPSVRTLVKRVNMELGDKAAREGEVGVGGGGGVSEATNQIVPSGVRVTLRVCVSWRDVKVQELIFP